MATGSATWNGATDLDWNVDTNWTPAQHPVDGDTATFDGNEAAGLPTSNLPSVDPVNYVFTGVYDLSMSALVDGAGILDILVNNASTAINPSDDNLETFGTATLTAGRLQIFSVITGDVVLNGGFLQFSLGELQGNVTATADSSVDWSSSVITGSFDADGNTITHGNTDGSTLTCNVTATLDLGATADTGIAIDIQPAGPGTVTLGAALWCGDLAITSGTLASAGFAITASGDVPDPVGTFPDVDLTLTGTGNLAWNEVSQSLASLTFSGDTTLSLQVFTKAIAGSESVALGNFDLNVMAPVANWNGFTGSMTGTGTGCLVMYRHGVSPGTVPIDVDADITFDAQVDNQEMTLDAGIKTSKDIALQARFGAATYILNTNGHTLVGDDVRLGFTSGVGSGVLSIDGMASLGTIVDGHADNTANAFNFGGGSHVEFSGLGDFDNIAVTASVDMPPEIVCPAGGSVANCVPNHEIALFGDDSVDGVDNGINISPLYVNTQDPPGGLMLRGIGGGRLLVSFLLMGMAIFSMMTKGIC